MRKNLNKKELSYDDIIDNNNYKLNYSAYSDKIENIIYNKSRMGKIL